MTTHLYTNAKGRPVTSHSYSGSLEFQSCPRKYQLSRIRGWRERKKTAARELGTVVESAIQFFHENKTQPMTGVARFVQLWSAFKDQSDLIYTNKEGSWADLDQVGREMLALYELKWSSFLYQKPVFQLNYRKEPFPNSHLSGIEDSAYVDMLATYVGTPDKPEPIIVDIKVTGSYLGADDEKLLTLDPQLRHYSWISGVPLVGFLWLQKMRPEGYKRGDSITLLVDKAKMKAGDSGIILSTTDDTDEVAAGAILTPHQYEAFEEKAKGLRGKALEAIKTDFGLHHATGVHLDEITKQRLTFVHARIPAEDMIEAGESIGMDIVSIVDASERNSWPKRPSIRFPDQKCKMCQFLPICTGDDAKRDETLYQIGEAESLRADSEADWISEFEASE